MGKIPYEIKEWKFWKVADYPELVTVEQRLAEKGLKQPWLRNEAWRYQAHLKPMKLRKFFFRGFGYGLGAFLVAVGIETYLKKQKEDNSEHH